MRNVRHCYGVQRLKPSEMSGAREGRAFQPPFRKPGAKPFGNPGGGFGKKFDREPDARAAGAARGRPWKTRRPADEDAPRRPFAEERADGAVPQSSSGPNPHAGKFYERYVKRPRAKSTTPSEARDERELARPMREFPSSERPQRIPSSAGARLFQRRDYDRPRRDSFSRRDDQPTRGNSMRPNEDREPMRASSGFRRDFGSSGRRDDHRQRDDRRDDRRPWQDRPREDHRRAPGAPVSNPARQADAPASRRDDDRRSTEGHRRASARPAPHLERRIIRSEGAKADQPPRPQLAEAAPLSAAREIAARVLLRRLQANAFVEDLLDDAFTTTKMRPDDRRLTQEMVYGCVRRQGTLDWLVARKTDGRPQQPQVQVFLRLGLYQLFFLDRIPPHAACYETVEIAKRLGLVNQANFINAILRRCDAERAEIMQLLVELKARQPHVGFSHPDWLVQKWTERWGADDTRRLLEWNNTAPLTHVRVNTLKTEPAKLLDRWRLKENVEYDFVTCPWADEGHVFALKSHPPLAALGSFRDGWFYVQDPSTLLAVQSLDPWAGESILDLCAAPGGKTAYIAQKMENDGELLACDISADRLKLVTENCTRLGVTCVKTLALGEHPEAALEFRKFDKVLVDAPCSNTGVLRRRVDLRWRLQPEEIAHMRETQLKLLHLAGARLKPGGTLVYSTCSLEPEENGGVVQEFLGAHPQLRLESERDLLPFRDGADGAYVAKLRG